MQALNSAAWLLMLLDPFAAFSHLHRISWVIGLEGGGLDAVPETLAITHTKKFTLAALLSQ